MIPRFVGAPAMVLALGLVAAACGTAGGQTTVPPSTTTPTTAPPTTTTAPPTTTTTTAPPLDVLTGLPLADPTVAARPAVVVKIDNAPRALPQVGLDAAAVVYEEMVEGITRFAAVFHADGADPVGPVRSARTTDVHLLAQLGRPLLAWSGGNAGVTEAVRSSALVDAGVDALVDDYWRERGRAAPHDLFTSTSALWDRAPEGATPPPPLFAFRPDGQSLPADAEPVTGVEIRFHGGQRVGYTWDPTRQGWSRSQDGAPHTTPDGTALAPENVVVQFVDYAPSPADPRSPEAVTVGEGEAWVLTAGHLVRGRWVRPTPGDVTQWLDATGQPIALSPGRTWVALPPPGTATVVPPVPAETAAHVGVAG